MSETAGDFLLERLHASGVRLMFGYPGDGINGVFGALNRAKGKIRFITVQRRSARRRSDQGNCTASALLDPAGRAISRQ
jgi:hypothetical protein